MHRVDIDVRDDGIAVVSLARPDKLNALDLAMFRQLTAAAHRLGRDHRVRVVVLRGQGRAFSSGLDVKQAFAGPKLGTGIFLKPKGTRDNLAQRVAMVWRDLDVPVIASLHGKVYGGALQIALATDFRLATPDAELAVMEIALGIIPDMGISVTLRELVRADVAKHLAMTGRIVSGVEAAELGLVTEVHDDPFAAALELAGQLASRPRPAIRGIKALFRDTWASGVRGNLRRERHIQTGILARQVVGFVRKKLRF